MTTKLSAEKFKQAVNIANRFISLRPSLPVLANIKVESSKTKLKLSATNLENSIVIEITASGESWETTIPAKLLLEFINLIKGTEVKLVFDKDKLEIISGEAQGSFNTIASSEFPTIPAEGKSEVSLSQTDLYAAVQNIAFAASVDEGKPVLNGILLRGKNGQTSLVATDSYRLALYQLSEDHKLPEIIVPAKAFLEAVKIAGELGEEIINLGVASENNQIFVSGNNFQVITRLIDGVYPNFEQIIPTAFVCEIIVSKESLVDAVKQAAVFARDTGNVVKIFVNKKGLRVWASTKQVGEGSSSLSADVSGENMEIAFNSRFLLDGLDAVSGKEARLKFSGSLKPAKIFGENEKNFNYIVMPVKPQS